MEFHEIVGIFVTNLTNIFKDFEIKSFELLLDLYSHQPNLKS